VTMEGEIVVGTVRGTRKDGKHIVVRRDGRVMDVLFDGDHSPLIGGDVIGRVRFDEEGTARMTLKPSVLDALLEGKATIYLLGSRPDLTARRFAKMLARSKSAVMSPGQGASIERSPVSEDPDLQWALDAFQPEAERLNIALNVIDIQTVARSEWQKSSLRDFALPADVEGNRRAMNDLMKLLRTGFTPQCNRMIEMHSGEREISVNFVLPYSPFMGAHGFAREVSRMSSGYLPNVTMTIRESRRLSSARNIALALAHNRLGAGRGIQANVETSPRTLHMAACFADAAASLAFIAYGGRRTAVYEYADLKEASLHFGRIGKTDELQPGVLAEATHKAIRAAAAADMPFGASAKDIVNAAVRIAKRVALPANRFSLEEGDRCTPQEARSAEVIAGHMATEIMAMDFDDLLRLGDGYKKDIEALVDEFRDSPEAAARLLTFAPVYVPDRLRRIFDEAVAELPEIRDLGLASKSIDKDKLAMRIRARAKQADDEIEFAVPGL